MTDDETRWPELCDAEPRLRLLFSQVPTIMLEDSNPWICWSRIKMRMCGMVGWESGNRELASCEDYDVAYRTLLAEAERHWDDAAAASSDSGKPIGDERERRFREAITAPQDRPERPAPSEPMSLDRRLELQVQIDRAVAELRTRRAAETEVERCGAD